MSYEVVDQAILSWVSDNSLTLFDSVDEREARFCYISSERGECLQISVDPPEPDMVRVHLWDIETDDDVEVHLEWVERPAELRKLLDLALKEARAWLSRSA